MATKEQQLEFINKIVEGAIKGQKDFGVYASVTIAQGGWETGWGMSGGKVVSEDNNLFGIKFGGVHAPDITISSGSEATDDGGYYCHYESWSDSVYDHGYFLRHNSRYAEHGVFDKGVTADEQITRIMDSGYATTRYDTQAIEIMKYLNLYQYDTGEIPDNPDNPDTPTEEVWNKIIETSYNTKQLTEDEITDIKKMTFGCTVGVKYSFNKRKRVLGTNSYGKRLTFLNNKYILIDVRGNGFIIIGNDGSVSYSGQMYVNPKFLKYVETTNNTNSNSESEENDES